MTDVLLLRNCHRRDQIARVGAPFVAFDGTANRDPAWREWQSLFAVHRQRRHTEAALTGLLSFKFEAKTGLTGTDVMAHIAAHPDRDIYHFHHAPQYLYHSFNVWTQLERRLPGLTERAQKLFDRGGTGIGIGDLGRSTAETMIHCNYWVARPEIWDAFMAFVRPLARIVRREPDIRRALMSDTVYYRGVDEPYLPYVFELMMPTYLMVHPEIAVAPYRYAGADLQRQCRYAMQVPVVAGFADTIDAWDPIGGGDVARRRVLDNLNRVVHDHYFASGANDTDPWGGGPVRPHRRTRLADAPRADRRGPAGPA